MRLKPLMIAGSALLLAGLVAYFAARIAVGWIETRSVAEISRALNLADHGWAEVQADGLQVILSGEAPDEATRFRALSVTGTVVDAARVIDDMSVAAARDMAPPRFSVEILRNDSGLSLIGLIPAETDREALKLQLTDLAGDPEDVADFLETANHPAPEGWNPAVNFALAALERLPRSKISVAADRVAVEAITESIEKKRRIETDLARSAPDGLIVALDISAPRPVVTPFTLRFLIDKDGSRFDACTADTPEARDTILAAARAAGLDGKADCTVGLGVPTPEWTRAAVVGIEKLAAMGGGSITFSDADVTLVALDTMDQATFDRHVGELEAALPEIFALHAVLPEPVKVDGSGQGEGPPEFIATRSPEGQVQLRGRLTDERLSATAENFARARFGAEAVYNAARLADDLPEGWPVRVLTALEALSSLQQGSVVVQPDFVEVRGLTGNRNASAQVSQLLSEKLGDAENFSIEIRYDEALDPLAALPTAEECIAQIGAVIEKRKITFEPGSSNIDADALATIDGIVEVLRNCPDVQMEIAGHTDSQGREEMNKQLSQARANAVLSALQSRRILIGNLRAVGYGEDTPIADNGTEEGREANRRIEFTLIDPEIDTAGDSADEPETPQNGDSQ